MTGSPSLDALPAWLIKQADHEAHARTRLDETAWACFSGGAADKPTQALAATPRSWDTPRVLPRVLPRLSGDHTRMRLLGRWSRSRATCSDRRHEKFYRSV